MSISLRSLLTYELEILHFPVVLTVLSPKATFVARLPAKDFVQHGPLVRASLHGPGQPQIVLSSCISQPWSRFQLDAYRRHDSSLSVRLSFVTATGLQPRTYGYSWGVYTEVYRTCCPETVLTIHASIRPSVPLSIYRSIYLIHPSNLSIYLIHPYNLSILSNLYIYLSYLIYLSILSNLSIYISILSNLSILYILSNLSIYLFNKFWG
jgi:hypothetical protein